MALTNTRTICGKPSSSAAAVEQQRKEDMKFFNIIVHGVPYGQDIFSTDPIADESYIKTFYKQQDDPLESLFEIEVRKEGNQQVVYYHYLKRRDVFDAEGRAGSYFGFTLRTDVSCDEVALLFHHMDEVFRTRILDSLLERAGNGYRHLVKKYSQCESVVDSMVLEFNAWLSLPGIRQLFHEIPACPQAKSVSTVCNLAEMSSSAVVKGALQRGMTMRLSPDVPRNADQQKMAELNRKIATAFAEKERAVEQAKAENRAEMDRMNKSIQEQKTEIDRLNGETDRLKKENARLQEAYEQKANEVQRLKASEAQVKLLAHQAEIKQLIIDSLNLPETPRRGFHEKTSRRAVRSVQTTAYAPDDEEERWHHTGVTPASLHQKLVRSRKFRMVCAVLILASLGLCCYLCVRSCRGKEKTSPTLIWNGTNVGDSGARFDDHTANNSESESSTSEQTRPTSESSNGDDKPEPKPERNKRGERGKARKQTEALKASAEKQFTPSKKKGKSATSSHDDGKKNTSTTGSQSTKSEEKSASGENSKN